MGAYILKRILLMIPTLLGIMLMTFAVIQFVPGGPIEQVIAKMQGTGTDSTARIGGNAGNEAGGNDQSIGIGGESAAVKYRGAQWTVAHVGDTEPQPGLHCIVEVVGSRLIVERLPS